MKSRTSSCKATAFRKDIARFLPVWAGYFLFLFLVQVVLSAEKTNFWYVSNLAESIVFMGLVNCVYGFIVAQTLFGDLFNSRMCNGLHSLPLRREQWMGIHVWVGLLFSLIPTALMAAATEAMILPAVGFADAWQIPLYWWVGTNLQYLFFFGLAVFCAMCTGNRFAMTVVYGIVNFFSALLYVMVYQIYAPLLYGVVPQSEPFEMLCPAVQITSTRFIDCQRIAAGRTYVDAQGIEQQEYIGQFEVLRNGWIYLGILAVVGIMLLLIARQMYKKRKLECAGDFLAVRWLEPVFQVVFTVFSVAGFHGVFVLFFGTNSAVSPALLVIGLMVGWFAGRMLLERTARVFRMKNILGFLGMAALLALSLYITKLDPLNITGWIPAREDVDQVSLSMGHRGDFTTEDPEEIEEILHLHELAIQERVEVHPDYSDDFYMPYMEDVPAAHISLSYRHHNGWFTKRNYYILATEEAGAIARKYCSRPEVVVPHSDVDDADDFRHEIQKITYVAVSGERLPEELVTEEFLRELAEAILADCESGAMVQSGVYHPEPVIASDGESADVKSLYLDMNGKDFFCYLDVYSDCVNTLKVLEKTGVLELVQENSKYY